MLGLKLICISEKCPHFINNMFAMLEIKTINEATGDDISELITRIPLWTMK